jgi:hypothetical protein
MLRSLAQRLSDETPSRLLACSVAVGRRNEFRPHSLHKVHNWAAARCPLHSHQPSNQDVQAWCSCNMVMGNMVSHSRAGCAGTFGVPDPINRRSTRDRRVSSRLQHSRVLDARSRLRPFGVARSVRLAPHRSVSKQSYSMGFLGRPWKSSRCGVSGGPHGLRGLPRAGLEAARHAATT